MTDAFAGAPVEECPYPEAPWTFASAMLWVGLFDADAPAPLPDGLKPLWPMRRVVFVVRYRGGPLDYDELAVAVPARRGLRPGVLVTHMWVDSAASLWAGRRLWGLPKRLARFSLDGETFEAHDDGGLLARVRIAGRGRPIPLPLVGGAFFGVRDGRLLTTSPRLVGRFAGAHMLVEEWSPRFGYGLAPHARWALAGEPVKMTFPSPRGG